MTKTLNLILLSLLYFLLVLCNSSSGEKCSSMRRSKAGFKGMFVFGDSIVDAGNNKFRPTPLRANYLPYGIDFHPGGGRPWPTGRFTNGKNLADCVGDLLGLPLLPPFCDPMTKGVRLAAGVNYASSGSGILDATASPMGVISLSKQIKNFAEVTFLDLEVHLGCPSSDLLPHYLFLFSTGANDLQANFFRGGSDNVSLEFFVANLTSSLAAQITRLYNLGARKFAFLEAGPLGCAPVARQFVPNKACNETLNNAALLFNTHLVLMLSALQSQMPGFQFVVINFFETFLEFAANPFSGGFIDASNPCCEVSIESRGVVCRVGGRVCRNRSNHMHFDGIHPSEAFYGIAATRAYYSNNRSEVHPFNLQRLAQLST